MRQSLRLRSHSQNPMKPYRKTTRPAAVTRTHAKSGREVMRQSAFPSAISDAVFFTWNVCIKPKPIQNTAISPLQDVPK